MDMVSADQLPPCVGTRLGCPMGHERWAFHHSWAISAELRELREPGIWERRVGGRKPKKPLVTKPEALA